MSPYLNLPTRSLAEVLRERKVKMPPLCIECGVNRSDPPSKLCPGCEAYREHQR